METAALVLLLLALDRLRLHASGAAAILVGRYQPGPAPALLVTCDVLAAPDVAILKPLHGAEPALAANLASFLDQDYPGRATMLCGIADPADPAAAVVAGLAAAPSTGRGVAGRRQRAAMAATPRFPT